MDHLYENVKKTSLQCVNITNANNCKPNLIKLETFMKGDRILQPLRFVHSYNTKMETSQSNKNYILAHVSSQTRNVLSAFDFDRMTSDASTISLDLDIDRTTVSRILNKAFRDGLLIKLQGRPTIYISRKELQSHVPDKYIPSLITRKELLALLSGNTKNKEKESFIGIEDIVFFGSAANESMVEQCQQARIFISYPRVSAPLLIDGNRFTGKLAFCNYIHSIGKYNAKLSNEYVYLQLHESIHTPAMLDQFLTPMQSLQKNHSSSLIIIDNIEQLPEHMYVNFFHCLRNYQINQNDNLCHFILVSHTLLSKHTCNKLLPYTHSIIQLPDLNDRSFKEKVEFILSFFQKESDLLNITISVSKNIISCLAMSYYPQNIANLQMEIQSTIAKSFYDSSRNQESALDIYFDDLSDNVLNNITDVGNRAAMLESIFSIIGETNQYFIPNIKLQGLQLLFASRLDSNQFIENGPKLLRLSDVCRKDIHNATNLPMYSIKAIQVQELYDSIYPILNHAKLTNNEKPIYQLLLHLEIAIEQVKQDRYSSNYIVEDLKFNSTIKAYTKEIVSAIKQIFDIQLPLIEQMYINTYLSIIQDAQTSGLPVMLLVSYGSDIADSYKQYIDALDFQTPCYTLNFSKKQQMKSISAFNNEVMDVIKKIHQNKGVVIMSDVEEILSLSKKIKEVFDIQTITLFPISLPLVLRALKHLEQKDFPIANLKHLSNITITNEKEITDTSNHIFLNRKLFVKSNKMLEESLSFLNPARAVELLSQTLKHIYFDLEIIPSDELSIRFIHHSSFMIERVIKNETLAYRNTKKIIAESKPIYSIIEKNFYTITNQFGISIPPSELAMITEIFLHA